jgi:hypothetical protein
MRQIAADLVAADLVYSREVTPGDDTGRTRRERFDL